MKDVVCLGLSSFPEFVDEHDLPSDPPQNHGVSCRGSYETAADDADFHESVPDLIDVCSEAGPLFSHLWTLSESLKDLLHRSSEFFTHPPSITYDISTGCNACLAD